jgi:SPOR domain
MMQRQNFTFFVISSLLLSSCASTVKVTGGNSSGNTGTTTTQSPSKKNDKVVNEDLSQYRPKYKSSVESDVISTEKISPVHSSTLSDTPLHVNKRLDAVLDTIAMRNKSIKFTNGFRIQIYVGNDRKAADDAKIYTYQKYPEIFPYLSYQQPIYKVKIGDFLSRMDAERYFMDIKDLYPSAMILPDRVEIKKGMMVSK